MNASRSNTMQLSFSARSENEAFARVSVAAFVSQLDPTMEELNDLKTVISEAVTNSIIHAYDCDESKMVRIEASIEGDSVTIIISDEGSGIEDLELARQPLYTSKPELERSGMGFTIMENFMDSFEVTSEPGRGTQIAMTKRIESKKALYN
ncbi:MULTISPECIES: anti-sigma F factor [unclassified Paenibacillus]|uniref:anti-sigma F factor n=1 Tax=unclassified Paenibacillus TaxID=185978 RepID=UPI00095686D0|nr:MULTISPECIES: anti-sigma F factor [unclassified Paenibacillus]ASS65070.1 anti-sigma F factor [Paenibacillus sp. RUD330]SIQ49720.1 stage II sporulation protein AB (anti-sigma F factor) [Paenibacillus sp. RU4X]SIQ71618.1 stage II sporulation protein AB (anti-sigma F factor) [Paenibacillus sp. RU4T]